MKRIALLTLLLFPFSALADRPSQFAPRGRIITLEDWTHRQARIWAVSESEIIIYRRFDTHQSDELIASIKITPDQFTSIRSAVDRIQEDDRGWIYWFGGILHGPFVRLSFTSDGTFSDTRIEAAGCCPDVVDSILTVVDAALPSDHKSTFRSDLVVFRREWPADQPFPEVRKDRIKDIYKAAQPGATDNPDDAKRLREDH